MILVYGGLLFLGYIAVLSTLSTQLEGCFGFVRSELGILPLFTASLALASMIDLDP